MEIRIRQIVAALYDGKPLHEVLELFNAACNA